MVEKQLSHEFGTGKGFGSVTPKRKTGPASPQPEAVVDSSSGLERPDESSPTLGKPAHDGWAGRAEAPPPGAAPAPRSTARSSRGLIALLALAAAGAVLAYVYGDKILAWLTALSGGSASATPPPGSSTDADLRGKTSRVECSIFAPHTIAAAKYARLQVFLHSWDTYDTALAKALKIDKSAVMQDSKTLRVELPMGAKVTVQMHTSDEHLEIRNPVRSAIWNGEPTSVDFFVQAPTDSIGQQFLIDVVLFVEGQPVGELGLMLECQDADAIAKAKGEATSQLRSDRATRYEKIFFSYSSRDRPQVRLVAQGYDAVDQDFFMDILSLSAGERWQRELYKKIDDCDLFLLFWSENARQSQWVKKEVEYAIGKEREYGKPRFMPFPLEGPPPPEPWETLADRHIGAPIYYMLGRARAGRN